MFLRTIDLDNENNLHNPPILKLTFTVNLMILTV